MNFIVRRLKSNSMRFRQNITLKDYAKIMGNFSRNKVRMDYSEFLNQFPSYELKQSDEPLDLVCMLSELQKQKDFPGAQNISKQKYSVSLAQVINRFNPDDIQPNIAARIFYLAYWQATQTDLAYIIDKITDSIDQIRYIYISQICNALAYESKDLSIKEKQLLIAVLDQLAQELPHQFTEVSYISALHTSAKHQTCPPNAQAMFMKYAGSMFRGTHITGKGVIVTSLLRMRSTPSQFIEDEIVPKILDEQFLPKHILNIAYYMADIQRDNAEFWGKFLPRWKEIERTKKLDWMYQSAENNLKKAGLIQLLLQNARDFPSIYNQIGQWLKLDFRATLLNATYDSIPSILKAK